MRRRTFATVAITAVLLMGAGHRTPRLQAQAPAASSGIPNLTVVVLPDGREIKAGAGGGTLDIP